eukprot:9251117-Karenia_brevis.AAC.1
MLFWICVMHEQPDEADAEGAYRRRRSSGSSEDLHSVKANQLTVSLSVQLDSFRHKQILDLRSNLLQSVTVNRLAVPTASRLKSESLLERSEYFSVNVFANRAAQW